MKRSLSAYCWGSLLLSALVACTPRLAVSAGSVVASALAEQERSFRDLAARRRLLDDRAGRRVALERRGVDVNLYYNHFYGAVVAGGSPSLGAAPHSGSVDLIVVTDLERAARLPRAQALVHVKAHFHENVNPRVAALSDPFDDADGNSWFYVDQLWYEQALADPRLRLRIGYLDQQTILDRNAYANSEDKQFMATFLDNNSATVPLAIGLGAALFAEPARWLTLIVSLTDAENRVRSAGFDSAFDDARGYFRYLEADVAASLPSPRGALPGTYRFGVVSDPRERREFESPADAPGAVKHEDVGFYASFDQMVFRERPGAEEGIGIFARYGYRDGDVNKITHSWSAGTQYRGLVARRPDDVLGLGIYGAHLSNAFDRAQSGRFTRELGCEVYYSMQVTPWLAISPDVQFISTPGAERSADDVWVFGLRGRVTL